MPSCRSPEALARRRERKRERDRRPEVRKRKEESRRDRGYYKRPEVRARKREYAKRPEVRARNREHRREYRERRYKPQRNAKACVVCGHSLAGLFGQTRYCSSVCKKSRLQLQCFECGGFFYDKRERKFCSKACTRSSQNQLRDITCIVCSKLFVGKWSAKFCSDCRKERERIQDGIRNNDPARKWKKWERQHTKHYLEKQSQRDQARRVQRNAALRVVDELLRRSMPKWKISQRWNGDGDDPIKRRARQVRCEERRREAKAALLALQSLGLA
jgi:hypothetical protein